MLPWHFQSVDLQGNFCLLIHFSFKNCKWGLVTLMKLVNTIFNHSSISSRSLTAKSWRDASLFSKNSSPKAPLYSASKSNCGLLNQRSKFCHLLDIQVNGNILNSIYKIPERLGQINIQQPNWGKKGMKSHLKYWPEHSSFKLDVENSDRSIWICFLWQRIAMTFSNKELKLFER